MSWDLSLGATPLGDGRCRFRVWAPLTQKVKVHVVAPKEELLPMERGEKGYYQWFGLPIQDYILYELHVGTFTPEGTFDAIIRFHARIAHAGIWNSLSQTLLKMASPGVPDFYQGTELWDFSLVDPDNRRPVDFPKGIGFLEELKQREARGLLPLVHELFANREDGRIKLYVTYKALNFRRTHRELFLQGDYLPLYASGKRKEHVCAFARRNGKAWALIAVPRLLIKLVVPGKPPLGRRVWGESTLLLPPDAPLSWLNILTGETLNAFPPPPGKVLRLSDIFHHFPVALLSGTSAEETDSPQSDILPQECPKMTR